MLSFIPASLDLLFHTLFIFQKISFISGHFDPLESSSSHGVCYRRTISVFSVNIKAHCPAPPAFRFYFRGAAKVAAPVCDSSSVHSGELTHPSVSKKTPPLHFDIHPITVGFIQRVRRLVLENRTAKTDKDDKTPKHLHPAPVTLHKPVLMFAGAFRDPPPVLIISEYFPISLNIRAFNGKRHGSTG